MKKVIAIALTLALILSMASFMTFVSADKGDVIGAEITDYRVTITSETSKFEKTDAGLLLTNGEPTNVAAAVNLKEAVTVDGLEFTITPTMWSMQHWYAFTLSNKSSYTSGNTDHNSFGKGIMVLFQYVATYDYINTVVYSINENGFAVGNVDIACIGSEYMYPTESATVKIVADDTYGYVIYINDMPVTKDTSEKIDMTRLTTDFEDGKAYLGFSMFNGNGIDTDTLLIERIKDGGAAPGVSEPTTASSTPAPEATKGGCGNKA